MSERNDETARNDTEDGRTGASRRTFLKTLGAGALVLGGAGAFAGSNATAATGNVDQFLSTSGDVTIPPGTYDWSGSGIDVSAGDSLVGGGNPGDVVWDLNSGTMDGTVKGTFGNVVVRGKNHQTKAGIDIYPGSTVDGFVWPEGGQQPEDRAFYTPENSYNSPAPATLRRTAVGWCANNCCYTDWFPLTVENCAFVNNNISNLRVGHAGLSDPTSETTTIRNTLIAVTRPVVSDGSNSPNARGLRFRHAGDFVVENCWFVYLDVNGAANPIEIHGGTAGSNITIRNCHFYNDSSNALIRDKSGSTNVTIENCTVAGSGSTTVEPNYSGSGVTNGTATVPLPSAVTGYAAADDIEGVGAGIGPWTSTSTDSANASAPSTGNGSANGTAGGTGTGGNTTSSLGNASTSGNVSDSGNTSNGSSAPNGSAGGCSWK